jgi:signal transduction histidine kinase
MTTPADNSRDIAALQVEVRHLAQNIGRLTAAIERMQDDHESRIRRLERAVLALMVSAAVTGSAAARAFGLI